jgi:hypothetical protein
VGGGETCWIVGAFSMCLRGRILRFGTVVEGANVVGRAVRTGCGPPCTAPIDRLVTRADEFPATIAILAAMLAIAKRPAHRPAVHFLTDICSGVVVLASGLE